MTTDTTPRRIPTTPPLCCDACETPATRQIAVPFGRTRFLCEEHAAEYERGKWEGGLVMPLTVRERGEG